LQIFRFGFLPKLRRFAKLTIGRRGCQGLIFADINAGNGKIMGIVTTVAASIETKKTFFAFRLQARREQGRQIPDPVLLYHHQARNSGGTPTTLYLSA
jgi:hypothetical protein